MKASVTTLALICFPALLAAQQGQAQSQSQGQSSQAQQSTQAKASVSAQASVQASSPASASIPSSFSAQGRARIQAAFSAAREKNLPQQPMQQRMAEAQARGATEAQTVASVQHTEARMAVVQRAMIRAGRTQPQQSEIASGEQAMARGATEAQIEAAIAHAPAAATLDGSFDALASAGATNGTGSLNGTANAAA